MSYVNQPTSVRQSTAISGVVIIHAAIGLALVTGLATNFIPADDPPPMVVRDFKLPPPPPPQKERKPKDEVQPKSKPDIFIPTPPLQLPIQRPELDTIRTLPLPRLLPAPGPMPKIIPQPAPTLAPPPPSPTPSFDPVSAAPRNDQTQWITTADYRTNWIRRGYEGTASFRLEIAANGRVSDCTVTKSTGHSVLDQATCELATRRARFDAARDSSGNKTTGIFTSSVRWQIPG